MARYLITAALAGLCLASPACAQVAGGGKPLDRVARVAAASPAAMRVDPYGRITPIKPEPAPLHVIGSPTNEGATATPDNPCPDAIALEPAAAQALVRRIATEEDFFPDFVMAVAKVESNYDSTATSPKGAYGLFQLMPALASDLKVDRCKPEDNVRGGVRQLRALHAKYKNPMYILSAYNAGEQAMLDADGIPRNRETIGYIAQVLNEFYRWSELRARADGSLGPAPGGKRVASGDSSSRHFRSDDRSRHLTVSRPVRSDAPGWASGFVMNFD